MTSAMERIVNLSDMPERLRGGVVAIGNFDGVHRGHRVVLERALEEAKVIGAPPLVLTFDPHPRQVFRPDVPHFRLTPTDMKARLISALGFDAMVELPFSREFAAQSAEEFIERILVSGLGIRHVVTGFDFHFGKDRRGGPAFLMASGEAHGFRVALVDAFRETSERTQLLITSHSPHLVDLFPTENIRVVTMIDGETRVTRIRASQQAAIKEHLLSLEQIMSAEGLLPEDT